MRFPPRTATTTSDPEEGQRVLARLLERIERKGAACRRLLTEDTFDLVTATFYEAHTACHQFWHCRLDDGHPLRHAIRQVHEAIDREMGLILEQIPRDANVVILSQFGMSDQFPSTGLTETFCRRLGYHAKRPAGTPSLRPIDLARRLIPQPVRFALSKRLSRETQERLLADQLRQGTDWSATTAFAIPSLYTGFIRVNLRGREPDGCVEPGADYTALLDAIEADLRELIDPRSGEPAVQAVHRTVDVFGGDPPVSLPDVFVEWRPRPYFQDLVVHPRADLTQQRPSFCPGSEEVLSGFVAASGPSIVGRGDIGEVPILDIAPTLLSLLGAPAPAALTGRALEAVLGT